MINCCIGIILLSALPFCKLSHPQSDSLVLISELNFHSEYEEQKIKEFMMDEDGGFELFLAIDPEMNEKESIKYMKAYQSVLNELNESRISEKKILKKTRSTYSLVHDRFMKKYDALKFFPDMFVSGDYNCVTASMVFAMVFDEIGIPYKIMASPGHVYLIANPGPQSMVIETTNPGLEQTIFTGEFKQQYVDYLKSSKLISEEDFKNRSVEEIFEGNFKQVKEAEFRNLAGFQYYNKAIKAIESLKMEEAFELLKKAWVFYPDSQVRSLMFNSLLVLIEKCRFDRMEDMDYLSMLYRFDPGYRQNIVDIFQNVLAGNLQYTGKEALCDSMCKRLCESIKDPAMVEELSFSFNLQMSYMYQGTDKLDKYIDNAMAIKSNHRDVIQIMENNLRRKLMKITDPQALVDSVIAMEGKYSYPSLIPFWNNTRIFAFLSAGSHFFRINKPMEGERNIALFEENYSASDETALYTAMIEDAYLAAAMYYFRKNYKSTAKKWINRGLELAPYSRALNSVSF